MSNKLYIGIDNGSTGTIGIIHDDYIRFELTPVFETLSYTHTAQYIKRLNVEKFTNIIMDALKETGTETFNTICVIERPMINPKMFKATLSAVRIFEAQLCVLDMIGIPYRFIDSKHWQRDILPVGVKTSPELKKASMNVGLRLFPSQEDLIRKHKDADGMLIAEWARRKNA